MINNIYKKNKLKFNNKIVIYDNKKFHSILECNCYRAIKNQCMLKNLILKTQVPFILIVKPRRKYIADFVVSCPNTGKSLIIDAKGIITPTFRIKSAMMESLYQKVWCAKTPAEAIKLIRDNF